MAVPGLVGVGDDVGVGDVGDDVGVGDVGDDVGDDVGVEPVLPPPQALRPKSSMAEPAVSSFEGFISPDPRSP